MFYTADDIQQRIEPEELTLLGYEPSSGEFCAVTETDRRSGLYITGVQGVGKSGLLQTLIEQDVQRGRAVVVIDPHGDLIDACLAQLPLWQLPKAYLLDLEDEAYPIGVNLFAHRRLDTDADRTQVVERIMNIFELLWADVLSQQNLPRYVRAATHVLLDNPGSTLVDMYAFLLDNGVRGKFLKHTTDPTVKQFWQQYDQLTPAKQSAAIQPLLNRLEALFMGRALVRNVVGQKMTTISFRRAVEDRELIFIKLPVKTLKQDAELIGTILLSQLAASVFSFKDLPPEQRPGLSLFVDEFQHFSTPTFAELFTEGRKFGVRLTIAHQYRDQLPTDLQKATMTARTKVVFQTTPEDGREMAQLFPDTGGEFEINPHASAYLLDHPEEFPPAVQVFIEAYLRPFQSSTRGGKVTIKDPEETVTELVLGGRKKPPVVSNPLPALDMLLKEVMRTQSDAMRIPDAAVEGFANCGRGFHKAFRSFFTPGVIFEADYQFPRHLTDGRVWKRPPENALEQLQHCLFHLRMTMRWLKEHPVGTQKHASVSDIGRMMSALPRRVAFVKCGTDGGVIRTFDTPEAVEGEALSQRLHHIRAQSRLKYAHPRAAIERDEEESTSKENLPVMHNAPDDDSNDAAPPRWEDVS